MSLFDTLLGQAGNIDINGLAARVGLNADQLRTGGNAVLERITGRGEAPQQAAEGAAAETGIPLGNLQALLPMLQEMMSKIDVQTLLSNPSQIMDALDRDGDGGVMDDLGDMAKGLFGGRS
jgi:hypothetical protein